MVPGASAAQLQWRRSVVQPRLQWEALAQYRSEIVGVPSPRHPQALPWVLECIRHILYVLCKCTVVGSRHILSMTAHPHGGAIIHFQMGGVHVTVLLVILHSCYVCVAIKAGSLWHGLRACLGCSM